MFRGSDFNLLYQPSFCHKRVWMDTHCPELAKDDSDFRQLLLSRGRLIEERHLSTIESINKVKYTVGDFETGFKETIKLIASRVPVIYQPVLIDHTDNYLAIPDFLIFDPESQSYKLRDVKLAVNLKNHPEIKLQMGLYRLVFERVLCYTPNVEILKGNGELVDFEPALASEIYSKIDLINSIRNQPIAPTEAVGWSKCSQCMFKSSCWEPAIEVQDIATIPFVDQGISQALRAQGISNYNHLYEFSEELLADIERPRGKRMQRIGPITAKKIKHQVDAMIRDEIIMISQPQLPTNPGQRPVVMFDIENDVFDPDLGVKVYLWGSLVAAPEGVQKPSLIVAGQGVEGDRQGWFDYLYYMKEVFNQYGDVPIVHYSSHEKTWVTKYIERYGDPDGIGERILNNLWDMYACIQKCFFLPIPSYGLKYIEKLVGFERSQEDYGGLWSIITYDQYINASTPEKSEAILFEILTYNTEDIVSSLAVYEWLETFC